MDKEQQLLQSLLEKIYNIVTGPDQITNTQTVGGSYVSFCCPGIPVADEDLNFEFINLNNANAAADFASLVNSVPPARGYWVPSDRKIESYYHKVLEETIRPVVTLNDNEKKSLHWHRIH